MSVAFSDDDMQLDLQIHSPILVSCPLSEEYCRGESKDTLVLSLRLTTKIPRGVDRNQPPHPPPDWPNIKFL